MRARDLDVLGFPKVSDALRRARRLASGLPALSRTRTLATRVAAERALERQWGFFRLLEVERPAPARELPGRP